MQNIYNKQYLKELNIQRNYLNRFMWDKASYPLRLELFKAVSALDKEIEECRKSIFLYKQKKQLEEIEKITIYDLE